MFQPQFKYVGYGGHEQTQVGYCMKRRLHSKGHCR